MRVGPAPFIALTALLLAGIACGPAIPSATETPVPPSATPSPPTPSPEPESTLVSIDSTWSEYVNHRLGFSIRIPHTIFSGNGGCVWREDATDHSYRPVMAEVPSAVFEDADRVYLTAAEYAELTGETQEAAGAGYRYFYSGCQQVTNTLELVRERQYSSGTWEIVVRQIDGDADLEALIDDVYGEACQLGGTSESDLPGVLRVQVQGDGLPQEETACWINYMYVFFYDPALQRAATWATGQSIYFVADPNTYEGYDGEMIDSFRFLP